MTDEMTRKERILVVEDNEDAQGGYGALLRRWDFDVLCVSSAEDALTYFYEYQPALLITDVELPGMDGLTLLSRLGDELRSIPAIIITGKGSEDRAVAAIEVGAFWYVEKPLSGAVLRAVLDRACHKINEQREADALLLHLQNTVEHITTKALEQGYRAYRATGYSVEDAERMAYDSLKISRPRGAASQEAAIDNTTAFESGPINDLQGIKKSQAVGGAMNRKQRTSIQVGFLLVILATVFPPWRYRYPGSSYRFLFSPPDNVSGMDLTRLFVEWLLVAFLVGAFLLTSKKRQEDTDKKETDSISFAPKKRRLLVCLTIVLAGLVIFLGLMTYAFSRTIDRLDAGIENVKSTIYNSDAANQGHFGWSQSMSAEEARYNEVAIAKKDELLTHVRQELEALH